MGVTVGSRIIMDSSALGRLDRVQMQALGMTADEVMSELKNAGVMPFDKGQMQNANTFVDDGRTESGIASIVTASPQARRLYYHPEYHFTKKDNAEAGGKWFERFNTVESISRIYTEMIRMLGGL